MRITACLLALCLLTPAASAQPYVGASAGLIRISHDETSHLSGATLIRGHRFTPHLALEGRLGTALQGQGSTAGPRYIVDYHASALLRLDLRADDIRHYLLLGASQARLRYPHEGEAATARRSGLAYGAGVSIHVGADSLQLDYVRQVSTARYALDTVNLAFVRKF